jgi:acyl carrier protein
MTEPEIKDAIAQVLRKIAPEVDLGRIGAADNFREAVDIDSFDFLNLLVGLHDKLGVDIPEAAYGKLRTLGELVAYLAARVR